MAEPTVREALEANIAAVNETVEAPVAEAVADTPVESAEQKAERARDEQGRFAKPSSAPESSPPTPSVPPAEVQVAEPIQRPSSWKKDMWPVWDKMAAGQSLTPQEARQVAEYNAQREQQFATGVSTYKQEADRAKPIMDAVAPFQAELDKYGVKAPEMVHSLLSAHRILSLGSPHEKLQNITKIIQGYGIPIQALFDQTAQQQYLNSAPNVPLGAPQAPPPDINKLVEQAIQNREVTQSVAGMERDTQKYPFFQYVRNTMAQLLETGSATDLDDAYQKALDAPEHSMLTTALQQQQAQVDEQRKLEAKQVVAKVARANVVSPKSATPIGVQPNGKPSVRDALRESISAVVGSARV